VLSVDRPNKKQIQSMMMMTIMMMMMMIYLDEKIHFWKAKKCEKVNSKMQ